MSIRPKMEALLQESNYNVDQVAAAFLAICPQDKIEGAKKHLAKVLPAYAGKADLFNQDYKDAKHYISWCVDKARDERISSPFTSGRGGDNPETDLSWSVGFSNLHDTISARKKLDKLLAKPEKVISQYGNPYKVKDVNPAMIKAMTDILNAAQPLAMIFKEMKAKVKKGRKPASKEVQAKRAAALAKKDMKTCACCFRTIARIKNGKIADHGFQVRGWGMRMGSCPGGMFKPLEVSNEGLKYMVKALKGRMTTLKQMKRSAPKLKKLEKKKGWGGKTEMIKPDHPDWDRTMRSHLLNIESEMKQVTMGLKDFESRLRVWQKTSD